MRKAGWIDITTPGRTHAVEVTSKGKQLLVDVMPHWEEAQNCSVQTGRRRSARLAIMPAANK